MIRGERPRPGVRGYWLVKQEPEGPRGYSLDRMREDGTTVWDGVRNNLALKHIRSMKRGDLALFYHTGGHKEAVGIVEVASAPYPDPEAGDDRWTVVDVRYKRALKRPVGLDEIRADPAFEGWDLLRISRLSVVPVPRAMWDRIMEMSRR